MAEVPELSDLLMDNSDNDELFYANDVPNKMKDNKFLNYYGSRVKLEIKRSKKSEQTLKKVKVLARVVERLKKNGRFYNDIFHDDDLLTTTIVKEHIGISRVGIEAAPKDRFLYNQTSEHAIQDSKRRPLKLEGNDFIVVTPLQGDNANLELRLIVNTYLENLNDNKRPVTLGIAGQNLYLCCTAQGIADQLPSLIEVDNIKEKKTEDELLPLMFYYRKDASLFSFESAAFPRYYLSASQNDGDKLQLMPKSEVFVTEFILTPRLA